MITNKNANWVVDLCSTISNLIGHTISSKHVHSDIDGWYYYIPKKSLYRDHPLIMNHYRGSLFVVIPHSDYTRLETGKITPKAYINSSVWSFGYYWGGGNMLYGAFWQPIEGEEVTGIHDTEKIRRYLQILSCRTGRSSHGYMPSESLCDECFLDSCPFSRYLSEGTSWDNEIQEHDDRKDFYLAVKTRIKETFGFDAVCCLNHTSDTILILPGFDKDSAEVYLPQSFLIDMLYRPGKHDCQKLANELMIEIGLFNHPEKRLLLDKSVLSTESCYDFWRENNACHWFDEHDIANTDAVHTSFERDVNIFTKLHNFIKSLR